MEEQEYNIRVNFSISYAYEVTAESMEEAKEKAIGYAYDDLNEDLRGNLDADDFGVEAEQDER